MGRKARFSMTLLVIFVLLAGRITTSKAQGPQWVAPDGNYVGSMALSGTVALSSADINMPGLTGEIVWDGVGVGPVEINVAAGTATGTWEINGDAIVSGNLTEGEASIEIEGDVSWGAKGDLEGEFKGIVVVPADELITAVQNNLLQTIDLTGESYGETTITVTMAPVPPQTVTESNSEAADFILYYQAVSCTQIQGGWVELAEASIEEAGLTPNLEGYWTVVRQDTMSEEVQARIQAKIAKLLQQAQTLKAGIDKCEFPGEGEFQDFLRDSNNLLNSIKKDQSCGISPNKLMYINPVTYAACSTISSWLYSSSSSGRNCAENRSANDKPTLPFDSGLLMYATASLGCFGQDFFQAELEEGMQEHWEGQLLKAIQNLNLSSEEGAADLLKIMDTASTMGLNNVVDAGKAAWSNKDSGGGE